VVMRPISQSERTRGPGRIRVHILPPTVHVAPRAAPLAQGGGRSCVWGIPHSRSLLLRTDTSFVTLGRPRWEDNIRKELRETGWEGLDWVRLAEDRDQWRAVLNTVLNLRVT
jgi:hypothetical protein